MKKALALLILLAVLPSGAAARDTVVVAAESDLAAYALEAASGRLTDARVLLASDIALTRPLPSIGSVLTPFSGEFDGQGHEIRGLVSVGTGARGLFAAVAPEGYVHDLALDGAYVSGTTRSGVIAGDCAGRLERCLVSNSRTDAQSKSLWGTASGSLAGRLSGTIIACAALNCTASGPANTGGLAGQIDGGALQRAVFTGVCLCAGVGEAPCGGLAGAVYPESNVSDCASAALVLSPAGDYAGGAAGGLFGPADMDGCRVFGRTEGRARYAAAFAGFRDLRARLTGCSYDPRGDRQKPLGYGGGAIRFAPRLRLAPETVLARLAAALTAPDP